MGSVEYDNEIQGAQLSRAYEQLKRNSELIMADLQRAREVQKNLLPDVSGRILGGRLAVTASFVPQSEVSGDYFDLKVLDQDRVAVVFCDVSGHGLAAALITGLLKTFFELNERIAGDPTIFVGQLNDRLCRLSPSDIFASVFYGVLDLGSMELRYCNGGHYPPPV